MIEIDRERERMVVVIKMVLRVIGYCWWLVVNIVVW